MNIPREPTEDPRGLKGLHGFKIQLTHNCTMKRERHGEPKDKAMKAPRVSMRALTG